MQSGRSIPHVVQKLSGIVKHYYRGHYMRATERMRVRTHRRRVKQDLKQYDEDTFDDAPANAGELFTEWDLW